ncbi:MOSC domain-containing protein [Streptacidiphilus sp. N1-12]|uniref:MOSC domain-containing protein n=2 Tax=Streptacidiphilus alkalitolerans TaxID=3342712 RepID=A0ABV6W7C5_9ACTN
MLLTDLRIHPVKSLAPVPLARVRVEPWGLAGDRRWMLVDAAGKMVSQREDPRLGQISPSLPRPGTLLVTAPGAGTLTVAEPQAGPQQDRLLPVTLFGVGFEAVHAGEEAAAWFSRLLGAELRLVFQDRAERRPMPVPTSLADGYPLLLTSTASLDALNAHIAADHPDDPVKGAPLPMGRFRANLVVEGAEPWAETGWKRIRIGGTEFRVEQQCGRCVITTLDPETGERRGPEPLRALARHRRFGDSLAFGMQMTPLGPADELGELRVGDPVTVLESGPLPEPRSRLVPASE